MAFNPNQTILEILESAVNNQRAKDVIARRFGLLDGNRQTLEEIGREYGITRERVRQIESGGLQALSQPKTLSFLEPHFKFVEKHLAEHGDLKREQKLLEDLSLVCLPAAANETKFEDGNLSQGISQCQSALYLILVLGNPFLKEKESNKFHQLWTVNKNSLALARKIVDYLAKYFQKASKTLEFKDLVNRAREIDSRISEKAIASYVDAAKEIEVNKFGQYGLIDWAEISPKGVKDKAYLALKKHGQPLHFGEITEHINKHNLDNKKAQIETVHNELIKDSRFVLVGRGMYALSEWGYEPGTVTELISNLLKQNGPLTKEEILEKVLAKRFIKENTILINLQNRKNFVKDATGKYSLKK